MFYRPGYNSDALAAEKYNNDRLEKQNNKNVARNEKEFGSELHMAGRNAYFKELFEGIELKDQQLPQIGPFENIMETHHFMEGYNKGPFLVEIGAIPKEYQQMDVQKKHR